MAQVLHLLQVTIASLDGQDSVRVQIVVSGTHVHECGSPVVGPRLRNLIKMASSKNVFYQTEIAQMMFVLGETKEPLDETLLAVEDMTRRQMLEIVDFTYCIHSQLARSQQQAHKRGSRFIMVEDLIFLMRHNQEKVNRLRIFLSWKDVRKNVKDKEVVGIDEVMEDQALGAFERVLLTRQKKTSRLNKR